MSSVSPISSVSLATPNFHLADLFAKSDKILEEEFQLAKKISLISTAGAKRAGNSADSCFGDAFILSETPWKTQAQHFLDLAYCTEVDAIIMLLQPDDFCDRCIRYHENYSDNAYTVDKKIVQNTDALTESSLEITPKGGKPKVVSHHHYKLWEDERPSDPQAIAQLIRVAMGKKKPLIHCYGGKGRAGTFATILAAYKTILRGSPVSSTLVRDTLVNLREERAGLIHNPDQYQFVYKVLEILLKEDKRI